MKIFVPSLGRVSTSNRDGSEKRFTQIFNYLLKKKKIELNLLTVIRQLRVYEEQLFNLQNTKIKLIKDITNSEEDSALNCILIYISRFFKCFIIKYPKDIDLIYSPSDLFVDVMPALLCKFFNKKSKLIVCMFLLVEWNTKNSYFSARKVLFIIAQRVVFFFLKINFFKAKVFVLNNIEKDKLIKLGFQENKIKVVKMPIDLNLKKIHKNNQNSLFIGRFHAQKGINDLIQITNEIIKTYKNFKLYIIGGGHTPVINELLKKIQIYKLDKHIKYLGFLDGEKKLKYLKECKFFFMPSYHESFGLTILEALNYKMKVICYDLKIYEQLFYNHIYKVNTGDKIAFARKYLQLIKEVNKNNRSLNSFLLEHDIKKVSENDYEEFIQ